MTLSDAGFWFRCFVALVGVCLVGRAFYPHFVERARERKLEREHNSVDAYIESLERQDHGTRK